MAASLNISRRVLTPGGGTGPDGSYLYGPATVAGTDTTATISIDRTATSGGTAGFSAQPDTTEADLIVEQSNDSGQTWLQTASAHIVGGPITYNDPNTGALVTLTVSSLQVSYFPGTGRQMRARVAVTGAPVAITGTLSTQ